MFSIKITFNVLSVKCNGLFSVLIIANLSTTEPQLSPLPLIPFLNICSPLGFKIKYYSSITTTLPNTYFYKLYHLFLLLAVIVYIPRLRHWTCPYYLPASTWVVVTASTLTAMLITPKSISPALTCVTWGPSCYLCLIATGDFSLDLLLPHIPNQYLQIPAFGENCMWGVCVCV